MLRPLTLKTSLTAANELAIRRAFEAAGVEFTNGDQPGLRLTRTAAARPEEPGDRSKRKVGAKIGRSQAGYQKTIESIRVTLCLDER